mmetsp:Transcript_16069/g.39084  ORF Transcript_16069/g.39084 Transcript_16069/m.39084 type:complete len:269 (-) Transcript_16069:1437-2243(-)
MTVEKFSRSTQLLSLVSPSNVNSRTGDTLLSRLASPTACLTIALSSPPAGPQNSALSTIFAVESHQISLPGNMLRSSSRKSSPTFRRHPHTSTRSNLGGGSGHTSLGIPPALSGFFAFLLKAKLGRSLAMVIMSSDSEITRFAGGLMMMSPPLSRMPTGSPPSKRYHTSPNVLPTSSGYRHRYGSEPSKLASWHTTNPRLGRSAHLTSSDPKIRCDRIGIVISGAMQWSASAPPLLSASKTMCVSIVDALFWIASACRSMCESDCSGV